MAQTGWAFLLSDKDHREEAVAKKLAALGKGQQVSSTTIVDSIPIRQVFGHQQYHAILKLEGKDTDALLAAFHELEERFSHVDGFI